MHNWQQRTELLLGRENLRQFHKMNILIVGTGGVGAYAAEMLCRAGIGQLTIVDGDTVNASNINRQLIATTSTIGQTKTKILANRLTDINPQIKIVAIDEYLTEARMLEIITHEKYNYVVDAIDTIAPKLQLIMEAQKHQIPVISSMGAGAKTDPSKIKVADISKTYNCNLARTVRKRLRKMGIKKGIKTVFSSELPNPLAVLLVDGERNKKSVVGTISYLPAMFGCFLAAEVLKDLLKQQDSNKHNN